MEVKTIQAQKEKESETAEQPIPNGMLCLIVRHRV